MSEGRGRASPRRREDARRRGDVAFSPALTGNAAFVAAVIALVLTAPRATDHLLAFSRAAFTGGTDPAAATDEAVLSFAWLFLPAAAAAFAAALVTGMLQTRGLLTAAPLAPALPLAPRLRRRQGLLRPLAFALIATSATAIALRRELPALSQTIPGAPLLVAVASLAGRVALRTGVVLLVAGLADFILRWLRRERNLRPTAAEARSEMREDAGDPRMRAERSRRGREHR